MSLKKVEIPGMIVVDGVPIAQNLSHIYNSTKRLGRLRWDYLQPTASDGMGAHPVDVDYGFELTRVGKVSGGIKVFGQDRITKLTFCLDGVYDFLLEKGSIKGNIGRNQVNVKLKTFFDIQTKALELILPILIGQKS